MFINKIIRNLNIKNFLIASLLISNIAISQNANAVGTKRTTTSFTITRTNQALVPLLAIGSIFLAGWLALRYKIASDRSPEQRNLLKKYNADLKAIEENTNLTPETKNLQKKALYKQLEKDSRKEYNKTLLSFLNSNPKKRPVQWLRDNAETNALLLRISGIINSDDSKLGNNLNEELEELWNDDICKADKIDHDNETYLSKIAYGHGKKFLDALKVAVKLAPNCYNAIIKSETTYTN